MLGFPLVRREQLLDAKDFVKDERCFAAFCLAVRTLTFLQSGWPSSNPTNTLDAVL